MKFIIQRHLQAYKQPVNFVEQIFLAFLDLITGQLTDLISGGCKLLEIMFTVYVYTGRMIHWLAGHRHRQIDF